MATTPPVRSVAGASRKMKRTLTRENALRTVADVVASTPTLIASLVRPKTSAALREKGLGSLTPAVVGLALALTGASGCRADEMQARALFKAMSDYLAAQAAFAFDFDTTLEIVSTDQQKLALASSGRAAIARPDKLHASRTGGFSSVEVAFDGNTLTLVNKHENLTLRRSYPARSTS